MIDGFSIPRWTLALVAMCIATGMMLASDLAGLVWGLPALYVIPHTIEHFRLARIKVTDDDIWAWVDRG